MPAQITETLNQGLKRQYKIVLPGGEIAAKIGAKFAEVGKNARLPGFRPGKVPMAVLKQRYSGAIAGEVLEAAINESAGKAIDDNKIRPAMQPKIENVGKFEEGKDLEFMLSVEALPDVEPMDFRAIALERLKVAVPEADIEATLKRLGEANPDIKDAEPGRAAQNGDVLNIDFVGTVDGATFQGGTAAGFHLRLGSGQFIPGFEEQLVGAKAGEKRDVNVTFPANYGAQHLAGKAAQFSCVVNEVKPAVPAAADDKLAEKAGLKTIGELREQVRKQMESDYGSVTRVRLKRQLLDKLAEAHSFAVPESMVESEFNGIWQQIEEQKKAGQIDEADAKKPEAELKAEYRKIAERRVRLGLLLAEVGKRNKVEVSQQELGQAIVREAQRYPGQERKVVDFYQKNEGALAQLRAPIFEDKVVDYILELAKLSEKSVTPAELQAIGEADEKAA